MNVNDDITIFRQAHVVYLFDSLLGVFLLGSLG